MPVCSLGEAYSGFGLAVWVAYGEKTVLLQRNRGSKSHHYPRHPLGPDILTHTPILFRIAIVSVCIENFHFATMTTKH